ncbi:MFS transporter [Azomonas macrocytogenes]|uniref:PPP family 3-phenylpropionic acid transporter n=1 Tax=Azomonas macrocytogenes TaxID=69962 RepID=A0A839T594_AZOMA|nr:MFS transporter [Azomonas macrocytogenes]MBB3103656.1 PPP family 3-phenylpropionic acid transporter [Azomonas macrocytogenes]
MTSLPLPYWRLSSFYFFYFALLGATAPFFGLYFAHLGFSAARIGELLAIPMLMRCFAPNLWGWLGDASGQRLAIVRLGAICTLLSFLPIFIGHSYAWLALVMALHAFFWHAVLPQFEVIVFAHLHAQAARYSQLRLWGSVGFIVAVAGLGGLFEHLSLDYWPQSIVLVMAGIVLATLWIPRTRPEPREISAEGGFWRQLLRPGVPAFYVCAALMQLSHGPYYTFISIYLESLGYGRGTIGLLWSLGVVAEILLFLVMAKVLKRFSLRQILIASFLFAALRWALLGGLGEQLPVLLFVQILHAATFGSFHVAAVNIVQRSFDSRQKGQGQALYASVSGIGGALGALYAGYSWSSLGPFWTFGMASLAALVAAVIIAIRLQEERA